MQFTKKNLYMKVNTKARGVIHQWGTGARKLLEKMEPGEIVGVDRVVVVSNHVRWGVCDIVNSFKAREDELPFRILITLRNF